MEHNYGNQLLSLVYEAPYAIPHLPASQIQDGLADLRNRIERGQQILKGDHVTRAEDWSTGIHQYQYTIHRTKNLVSHTRAQVRNH